MASPPPGLPPLEVQVAELRAQVAALTAASSTALSPDAIDTVWLLFSGTLVFFMQCGFGMLEAGTVSSKGTQDIMLKNLFDSALGGILWWLVGYGFTNEGGSPFIGISAAGGRETHFVTVDQMSKEVTDGVEWAQVFFQFTFAAAAATIVSGAVAERAMLPAYVVFSSLITSFIYPVVAHWVWSGSGWLNLQNDHAFLGGILDFAGSGVVHMTGGVAALAGSAVIGPRTGRFDPATGFPIPTPGHSSVLCVLGTFILWLGWYGFNAGSIVLISNNQHGGPSAAGRIVLTTTLAASAGGITSVVLERRFGFAKEWSVSAMCNGILSGLVSVTASCATVYPWAAIVIGCFGACAYRLASHAILRRGIDDPLDAFAVHGAGGAWGVVACSLLSAPRYTKQVARYDDGGLFYGGYRMFPAALVFLIVHILWVGSLSFLTFYGLHKGKLLRVPKHMEDAAAKIQLAQQAIDDSVHAGIPYEGHTAPANPSFASSVATETSGATEEVNGAPDDVAEVDAVVVSSA